MIDQDVCNSYEELKYVFMCLSIHILFVVVS